MQHLLSMADLTRKDIITFIDRAEVLSKKHIVGKNHAACALLFAEPSTRTRCSFELAAGKLGMQVINLDLASSSLVKDETMLDTINNLSAMGIKIFVIRHFQPGIISDLAKECAPGIHIVNAGDGLHQHPSQALLDMLTIRQKKSDFSGLKVAIVGDVLHSRVASSDIIALQKMGTEDIRLIGPQVFMPVEVSPGVSVYNDLAVGLEGVDVIISLRIQKERIDTESEMYSFDDYKQQYMLTSSSIASADDDVIIMHPGPVNIGVEVSKDLINSPKSVVLNQVTNGVFLRMAILEKWL
jgi:aspartate carbamoyltransferase catalytic subunit